MTGGTPVRLFHVLDSTFMNALALHPATRTLVFGLMKAKLVRALLRLRSPRRIVLSVLATLLAIVWIGQAIAGILFRESANPEFLRSSIVFSMTAYALWNVLKIATRKAVEPFEWTDSEKQWLIAAPLSRSNVIAYRFFTIVMAALFKSTIFTLVMIPDLLILPFGFSGIMIGLLIIDMIRMLSESIVFGLRPREFLAFRTLVIGAAVVVAISALTWAMTSTRAQSELATAASFGFLLNLLQGVAVQADTWYGVLLTAPFEAVADLILADRWTFMTLLELGGGAILLLTAFQLLVFVDQAFSKRRQRIEIANFDNLSGFKKRAAQRREVVTIRRPWAIGGVGALAWRQWQGVKTYRTSLLIAVAVPFALSLLPVMSQAKGLAMVMNVVGGLAFYSFLLLPTTFKFDFRRDVDRLAVLKSLPFSPMRIVLGQLAVPVLMTTAFQTAALITTLLISPYPPALILVALAVLIPFNLFIFGFDNLIFILYPHRINQEGIQVFLRSILAFTAKGLLFAVTLFAALVGMYVSKSLAALWMPETPQTTTAIIFSTGFGLVICSVSVLTIKLLAHAFRNFDPSCDLAGLD